MKNKYPLIFVALRSWMPFMVVPPGRLRQWLAASSINMISLWYWFRMRGSAQGVGQGSEVRNQEKGNVE
jgi:hypothetical protein